MPSIELDTPAVSAILDTDLTAKLFFCTTVIVWQSWDIYHASNYSKTAFKAQNRLFCPFDLFDKPSSWLYILQSKPHLPYITLNLPHITLHLPYITLHLSHITLHLPHFTLTLPHITVNLSHIKLYLLQNNPVMKPVRPFIAAAGGLTELINICLQTTKFRPIRAYRTKLPAALFIKK